MFPSSLGEVAGEGLALSAILIFVARPLAAVLATALASFEMRERLMLGWAGLHGAVPIWLATFPVIAGVEGNDVIFNAVFFVVTSTLVQYDGFDRLAVRLGLTWDRPAVPRPVVETGTVRGLGGDSFIYVDPPGGRGCRGADPGSRPAARRARQPDRAWQERGPTAGVDRDRGR